MFNLVTLSRLPHFTRLSHAHVSHVAHSGNFINLGGLERTLFHSIAWHIGGRVVNVTPLPVVLGVAVIIGAVFLVNYLRNKKG